MVKNIKNRTHKLLLGTFLVCIIMSANLIGQTISGRFEVIHDSDSNYIGKIQVKLQEGSAVMGNAVIRYKFNPNRLTIPDSLEEGKDFKIYNFQNGNYVSSVSHPSDEVVSINIAKLFGDDISITNQYMDVAEITFSVKDPKESNEFQSDIIQFFPPLSSEMWGIGDWVVTQGGKSFEFVNLVSPADGAKDLSTTVTLKWNKVDGAEKYNLQVSKDEVFTDLVYNNTEIADTAKRLTLDYNTKYFWRVSYSNSDGTSPFSGKYNFTTVQVLPSVVLISPDNGASNLPATVTLKWNKVEEANKYNLQVSKDEAFTDLVYNNTEIADTAKRLTLDYNTKYFWRVRYSNSNGTSPFSGKYNFTTMQAVPKVVLKSPANDSTIIGTAVTLKWKSVSNKDFYQLQVSKDSDFSDILISLDNLQSNEIEITDLEIGYDYYWRVRVSRNNVLGEYSNVYKFSTFSDVPKVVLRSPVNDSTINGTSVWLKWKSVSGRDYYQMQLATDDNFTNIVKFLDTLHINEILVDNLIKGETYYWRARASKYNVFGEYSNTSRFYTAYGDTTKPVLLTPANNEMDVNTSLTFKWEKIDTANYYQLEIAEDDNFDDLFYLNEDVSENKITVNDFEKGTRYYWRVRFASKGGNSMYSNVYTFETLAGTPTIPTLITPLNNSVDLGAELTFGWKNEGVADHFKIEIYRDSGVQSLFFSQDSVHSTSITINNFGQGKQYFWRVRSTNKNGNSGYSDLYKFRTRIGEPSILTLIEPMNSAVGLDNSIRFQWNPIDSAEYYNLEIAEDSDFRNIHFEISNISASEITVSNLDEGAQYYWRVKSHNKLGSITISNIFNFSTHVGLPDLPVALSPANNAKNVDTQVSFSWESTINTEFYHLEIATDKNFKNLFYSEDTLTVNRIKLKSIGEGRKYYWRVRALNNYGNSNFSDENKFTVKVNKPSNLAAKVGEDEFIKLSWKDNSKVEKRFIIERKIKKGDASEQFVAIDTLYSNETDYEDYSIIDDETYVYRVYSENNIASSDYSNTTELKFLAGEYNDPNIPDEFNLSQNYPNPFNPSTKINYSLKEISNVGIKIYNILGEVVETLVNDVQNAGKYTLEWNAANYSSGIYIYVMNAESNESDERFQASNKMILVK
ncbi:hypothetical protein MNBD_IGNAVI01-1220 [hydrothermal vent metagenome]|uniref:Fibronectin type-III domain-containing protein n=2 Tax=hydrothermal vent metagenome TaxID=652676 RepID=A0A3B1CBC6_9ZZZZ